MLAAAPVERGSVPHHLADARFTSPLVELGSEEVLLRLPGVGRLVARADGVVTADLAAGVHRGDVSCFVRGPLAAAAELVRGRFALRGAAVEVGDAAVVVAGASGAGKSTLAAALGARGHRVLVDGVLAVAVDGPSPSVGPATPGPVPIELWPDSVAVLGLDPADGRPVRPGSTKRSFEVAPPGTRNLPVGALVLLDQDGRVGGPAGPPPVPERLRAGEALTSLVAVQWHVPAVKALGLALAQLDWLAALAGARVWRLRRGDAWPATGVDELVDLVVAL